MFQIILRKSDVDFIVRCIEDNYASLSGDYDRLSRFMSELKCFLNCPDFDHSTELRVQILQKVEKWV